MRTTTLLVVVAIACSACDRLSNERAATSAFKQEKPAKSHTGGHFQLTLDGEPPVIKQSPK